MPMLVLLGSVPESVGQKSSADDRTVEVRELVDRAADYLHRTIVVRGCLIQEFEIRVLQPCDTKFSQFSEYTIWIDGLGAKTEEELRSLTGSREHPIVVVLKGQFEESKSRKYGHLNFYKRRFTVDTLVRHETSDSAR
jgi:hypothetical protein